MAELARPARLATGLARRLQDVLAHAMPDTHPLHDTHLLCESERDTLLHVWNRPAVEPPAISFPGLLQQYAMAQPAHAALEVVESVDAGAAAESVDRWASSVADADAF